MSAPTGAERSSVAGRAAARGGVVALSAAPLLALVAVVLLIISGTAPVLLPAGIAVLVLAAVGGALGALARRRSGPIGALRAAAATIAVAGVVSTVAVGLTVPRLGDGADALAAIGLCGIIVAAWWVAHTVAGSIRTAQAAEGVRIH
jgi:hypothetical protein